MASNFLSQAVISTPTNPNPHAPRILGFCSAVSGTRVSFSPLSSSTIACRFHQSVAALVKRDFVVRAEVTSEGVVQSEPEEENPLRKSPRVKLGDVMGILNKRSVEATRYREGKANSRHSNRKFQKIGVGFLFIEELSFIHTTIRIRRIIAGVGVEIVFPLYSANIKEIKVVNHRKVRRARLYFLRDKLPRLSTFK